MTHLTNPSNLEMSLLKVLAVLGIVSVTLAEAGVVRTDTLTEVLDVDVVEDGVVKRETFEHEEETCKTYERVIAPKIALTTKGKKKGKNNYV